LTDFNSNKVISINEEVVQLSIIDKNEEELVNKADHQVLQVKPLQDYHKT